jgi:hypothetical protein
VQLHVHHAHTESCIALPYMYNLNRWHMHVLQPAVVLHFIIMGQLQKRWYNLPHPCSHMASPWWWHIGLSLLVWCLCLHQTLYNPINGSSWTVLHLCPCLLALLLAFHPAPPSAPSFGSLSGEGPHMMPLGTHAGPLMPVVQLNPPNAAQLNNLYNSGPAEWPLSCMSAAPINVAQTSTSPHT